MKFKTWTYLFFLSFFFIVACKNEPQAEKKVKLKPDNWELLAIHPDLTDSIVFSKEDIFIDSNWYQIDAAAYGDLYRFYHHNHFLYQKGSQKGIKLGPINDTTRLAYFQERKPLLQQIFNYVGKKIPEFEFTSIDGQRFNSKDLKGKVIVFSFWFKNCIPYIKEIPEFNALVEKYKGQEVVFLAPALDTHTELAEFLQQYQFDFHIIADQDNYIMEFDTPGFPTNMIIDQKGKIQSIFVGGYYKGIMSSMIEKRLQSLL